MHGVAGYGLNTFGEYHAFLWNGSAMQDLGVLGGGSQSFGYAMKGAGRVVGTADVAGSNRAFVSEGSALLDLNTLLFNGDGWILLEAYDINEAGQIAGVGSLNGELRSVLLAPVASRRE